MSEHSPRKIAILGGGIGALAAAFRLIQIPDWQRYYQITVYQLGWRLGGKGASSRNVALGDRIEEHGLHVWAGFYENAFALMRAAYDALNRQSGPIQTINEAFLPENSVMLALPDGAAWKPWHLYFAPQPGEPGDGTKLKLPGLEGYLLKILEYLLHLHSQLPAEQQRIMDASLPNATLEPAGPARADALLRRAIAQLENAAPPYDINESAMSGLESLLDLLRTVLNQLRNKIGQLAVDVWNLILTFDLGLAAAAAIVNENVLTGGFGQLDQYDLIELLGKYGAWPETLKAPAVTALYDYAFAYQDGNRGAPCLSAASAFEGSLRLLFTYKGSLFYRMAAGAGEIIFAPLYEVLSAAGVQFEFFNRVTELIPDQGRIDSIQIAIQAEPFEAPYQPLRAFGGLPCWPANPLFDQLTNGDELRVRHIDLENTFENYHIGTKTLYYGIDFDLVILGIPAGALASLTPQLAAAGPRWRSMLDATRTVGTQALQLWLDAPLSSFGGDFTKLPPKPDPVGPILTAFEPPFDTWSDMSHLLKFENWPQPEPQNIAYFCAVLPDLRNPQPSEPDPQPAANAEARASAVTLLNKTIKYIWPNLVTETGFRWNLLHDDAGGLGEQRLNSQYIRANITGTERYVLSPPGLLQTRLPAAPDEFANLYLAGDWVRVSAINAGCMEVAVMAGFDAASSIASRVGREFAEPSGQKTPAEGNNT